MTAPQADHAIIGDDRHAHDILQGPVLLGRREGHQRWLYRKGRWVGSLVGREEGIYMSADRYLGERLDAGIPSGSPSTQVIG